jgi:hypothetical protein
MAKAKELTKPSDIIWPKACTCNGKSTVAFCEEHQGAWSYKCGACIEHVKRDLWQKQKN